MIGILFLNRCNLNIPRTYCWAEMINFLDRLQWRSFYARRMLAAHFIELTGHVSSIKQRQSRTLFSCPSLPIQAIRSLPYHTL